MLIAMQVPDHDRYMFEINKYILILNIDEIVTVNFIDIYPHD